MYIRSINGALVTTTATVAGTIRVGISFSDGLVRAESEALPIAHRTSFAKGSVAFGINQNAALQRLRKQIASDNFVFFGYGVSVYLQVGS